MNGGLWYSVEVNNVVYNVILNGYGSLIWWMVCEFARASRLLVACVILYVLLLKYDGLVVWDKMLRLIYLATHSHN